MMPTTIEILPPHIDATGATYRAMLYFPGNERMRLEAHVSEPLRRRMAAQASRALAWTKSHVRLPAGPMQDLMAGEPPDCGCDMVGETFRAAALGAADAGASYLEAGGEWADDDPMLAWSFDAWTGAESSMLPDLALLSEDAIGADRPYLRSPIRGRTPRPLDVALLRALRAIAS